jgi:hypothetical protein
MDRRRFLAALAAGAGAGLAGCLGRGAPVSTGRERRVASVAGADLPLDWSRIQDGGLVGAVIDPVVDPAFAPDWGGVGGPDGPRLADREPVIGLERGGGARAYPLRVVRTHEVVNDSLGGPVLVTYCPLCDSAVTAVRTVRARETTFEASGLLWRSNLLLRDEATASLWSQLAATAVRGPMTGARMWLVPSSLTTWGEWRRAHPDGEVLLPPPLSATKYGGTRAGDYAAPADEGEIDRDPDDPGQRTQVLGIVGGDGDHAKAYPRPAVRAAGGVVDDAVGGRPVVVALTPSNTLVGYWRTVDGRALSFSAGDRPDTMLGGGSGWLVATGTAVSGPHEGTTLARATDLPQVALGSWRDFHPETGVYGGEGG